MNWRRMFGMVMVGALAGGALAACGGDDSTATTATPGRTVTPVASASASASTSSEATVPAGSATAAAPSTAASPSASASAVATATPPTVAQPTATSVPPTSAPSGPQSASVGVTESKIFLFSPARVTVGVGGTVSWAWSDTTQFHNVDLKGPDGGVLATSGDVAKSGSLSFRFTQPGTYEFVCETHEFSIPPMKGTVTVQ